MPSSRVAARSDRNLLARRAVLAAVMLLAASLRLTRLGLIEFKYDEATTSRSALSVAREGHLPAVGMISSQGPRNPALMSYVLAPPFALSRDPRVAAAWLGLLGVAAVGLTYWVGTTFFDWRVGAVAAALFAASPWAVFQSRKLWTQNLPLVTLVFVTLCLTLVVRRRAWALAAALAAAGALISLHLGGIAFLFVLAAVLILFHSRVRPLPLIVGVALLLLILAPYLVHDAARDWTNLRSLAGAGAGGRSFNLQAPAMAARVASGYRFEDLAGTEQGAFLASALGPTKPDLRWLDQVQIALFWVGLAWSGWRLGREALVCRGTFSPDGQARAVLICWFLVPVALLTQRTPVQPHDFNLLYPVQHLIIALLLADIAGWRRPPATNNRGGVSRVLGALFVVLILALVTWQVAFQGALLTFVDSHDTPGGYGAPVKHAIAAAHRAEALTASQGAALVALLPGGEPRFHGPAAVFDVLLGRNDRRLVDGQAALVIPDRPTAYLVHPGADQAASILDDLTVESHPPLPLRAGSDASYRFFSWQPTPLAPSNPVAGPPQWQVSAPSGQVAAVSLLGYECSRDIKPGGAIDWTIIWRVDGEPPIGLNLHWFNHLVDENGTRWSQKDGVGLPVSAWQDGDTVFTWFALPVPAHAPPPPYLIRTGLYAYPSVVNVPVTVGPDSPPAQFVELGPIDAAP